MQLLCALLALALGSADVYRWTDANGQAHYSDHPQAGAERITITVSEPASGAREGSGSAPGEQSPSPEQTAPAVTYQTLTITTPAQEQVLWNIEGQLDVVALVQPELRTEDVLQFYLDGGRMTPAEPGTTRARFSEVYRGEHSLRVEIVDATGKALMSSPTTRFYVRQTALPNPVPGPKPKPKP